MGREREDGKREIGRGRREPGREREERRKRGQESKNGLFNEGRRHETIK